jgi:hypothetical protein
MVTRFQKYLDGLRSNRGAVIFVTSGKGQFTTFNEDCAVVASRCSVTPRKIGRYWQVTIGQPELDQLKANAVQVAIVDGDQCSA